ncbi:HAMP domain-containing protein [Streptomyces sp. Ncost-T10-10d]|uniref:HAMP domain-containing protein n=1 Tax=Streptomyces sp. Ncost-T10-10d TaxID=1839774 RepID=UPI002109EEDF|nr:HAMP domain-containing protein [Streptomyces sp. Ncost-T10-10d]
MPPRSPQRIAGLCRAVPAGPRGRLGLRWPGLRSCGQLAERTDAAGTNSHQAVLAAALGLAASTAIVAVFTVLQHRAVVRPVRGAAAAAQELAGGDLSVRVAPSRVAEIAALNADARRRHTGAGSARRHPESRVPQGGQPSIYRRPVTKITVDPAMRDGQLTYVRRSPGSQSRSGQPPPQGRIHPS